MITDKITLRQVKAWEDKAYDLSNQAGDITAEEARDLEYEVYSNEISYDYGRIYVQSEDIKTLKEIYTRGALKELLEDYDTNLVYGAMRRYLYYMYDIDESNSNFFDVNC